MKKFMVLLLACCCLTSCYHVRTVANPETQRDANPTSTTVWVYAWGLVQPRVVAPECKSQALQDVRTSTNLGYALITVATLGFVCPLTVEYTCAKPCDVSPEPQ
ncbi:MAG: hypothetical protein RIR53_465 [Bacteroidota bacterium]|jgi:hypothetical protein